MRGLQRPLYRSRIVADKKNRSVFMKFLRKRMHFGKKCVTGPPKLRLLQECPRQRARSQQTRAEQSFRWSKSSRVDR